jgi:hypothetical protein
VADTVDAEARKKLSETQLSMSEGELGKMKEQLKRAKIQGKLI